MPFLVRTRIRREAPPLRREIIMIPPTLGFAH